MLQESENKITLGKKAVKKIKKTRTNKNKGKTKKAEIKGARRKKY